MNVSNTDLRRVRVVHIFSDSPDIVLVMSRVQIIVRSLILSALLILSTAHQTEIQYKQRQ